MPKIPLAARPALPAHQDSTAPLTGAPSLNWRTDNGLQELAGSITRAAGQVGNMIADYAMAERKALDQGLHNDIRLLDKQHTSENQNYMADNPSQYERFPEYLEKQQKKYDALIGEKLNGMSRMARRNTEAYLADSALGRTDFMRAIRRQALVSTELTRIENQMQTCVNIDDRTEFERILDSEETAQVLTPALKEKFRAKYDELFEINEIRNAARSNSSKLIEKLDAVDEKGHFINFPHVSPGKRDEWRQHAVYLGNERFREDIGTFAAAVEQGRWPTVEELDRQHRDGAIDDRTYLAQKPFVERYWTKQRNEDQAEFAADAVEGSVPTMEELKTMRHAGEITDREFVERSKIVSSMATQQQRNEKEHRQQQSAIFSAKLEARQVPAVPQKKAQFRAEQYEAALKIAGNDFEMFNTLRKQIDKHIDEDDPFKKSEKGELVKKLIDQMAKGGEFAYKGDKNEAMQADRKLQFYNVAREMLRENKSVSEIQSEITKLNQAWQEKRIMQLFNGSGRRKKSETAGKVFDSSKPGFGGRGTSFFGGDTTVNRLTAKNRYEKDGWIDAADIIEEKPDENGRTMWKLKDGRIVYADDYIND